MLRVDSGIEIPKRQRGAVRKYPFYTMEIGDSVFVPNKTGSDLGSVLANAKPRTFERRKTVENDVAGVRIWRKS